MADVYGLFWRLAVVVEGPADPTTGYLCDIKHLDGLLRGPVAGSLQKCLGESPDFSLAAVARGLHRCWGLSDEDCPWPARPVRFEIGISPFTCLFVEAETENMVKLTQSFEFSAAHRLACVGLSDDENRKLFGKCSNSQGHGHNYVLEVTVAGVPADGRGTVTDLARLDRIVRERVIEPFDHRNLNVECSEFATLNPTVENIARVIWRRLSDAMEPGLLSGVRVWETPKTYAEYTGE